MKCTNPTYAFWTGNYTDKGKRHLLFSLPSVDKVQEVIPLPCGKCMGCRLAKSKETAIRAVHESRSYENNCFITLTVDEENMEKVFPGGSLDHRPWQLFAKRFRKKFQGLEDITHPITGEQVNPIRFLMCGEYGSEGKRPHFHACVFNFDFPDKELHSIKNGVRLYRSLTLEALWPFGFSTIGDVNFESAAYLARYITKKIGGDAAHEHYSGKKPEYITFPAGFGLGRIYYEKYNKQWYEQDLVRMGKHVMKPPKYYDRIFDIDNSEKLSIIKDNRILKGKENQEPFERWAVIEKVRELRVKKQLKRSIENDY